MSFDFYEGLRTDGASRFVTKDAFLLLFCPVTVLIMAHSESTWRVILDEGVGSFPKCHSVFKLCNVGVGFALLGDKRTKLRLFCSSYFQVGPEDLLGERGRK
jgi:hypothetical protein